MDNRRGWLLALCGFGVIEGIGYQMRGALLPTLQSEFQVSESLLGLVAPAGTVGFILATLLVGVFAGRLNLKQTVFVGVVSLTVCMFLLGISPIYFIFLGVLFIRGTVTALVRGLDRVILGHLFSDRRGQIFNLYAVAWAVGATFGPVLVVIALALGNWRYAYLALGVSLLPLAAGVFRLDLNIATNERPLTVSGLRRVLYNSKVMAPILALLFSGGFEGGLFIWLPYYANQTLPESSASLTLSALIVGYIPGRLVYSAVAEEIGYLRLVSILTVIATPLTVFLITVEGLWIFPTVIALGLIISGVFPTLAAAGIDAMPEYTGPINALAIGMAYVGTSTLPALMGIVTDRAGIDTALLLLLGALGGLLVVLFGTQILLGIRDYSNGS